MAHTPSHIGFLSPNTGQALGIISQRQQGQGLGLDQTFGALQSSLEEQSQAALERMLRDIELRQARSGTGRTGATAALTRGAQTDANRNLGALTSQLGVERANLINDQINKALGFSAGFESEFGNRFLQQQGIDLQRRDLENRLSNEEPGTLGLLGQGAQLGASLLGPAGVFPKLVPGIGKAFGSIGKLF